MAWAEALEGVVSEASAEAVSEAVALGVAGNIMSRLDQLLAFHKEDPDDSFVRFALASEYVKLKRWEEALMAFNDLYEKDPSYVGLYYHYGKLLHGLGKPDKAAAVYREGIAVATRITDFHARSELQSALLEMEIESDD